MSIQQRSRSVRVHDFAMNPRPDVPRSQFDLSHGKHVPFNFSDLVPILCEFVLPGDTWNCRVNCAARTAVPIVPIQDNWHLEYFCVFIPMRLLWDNAERFWGMQDNPGDGISYTIPQVVSPVGGFPVGSLYDYFGLPTVGQIGGAATISVNSLPMRGYNLFYNDWIRDENLQNSLSLSSAGINNPNDGPDNQNLFQIKQRGKRFDYISQALPWPQKGATAITLPMGTSAPIKSTGVSLAFDNPAGTRTGTGLLLTTGVNTPTWSNSTAAASGAATFGVNGTTLTSINVDLSTATGPTLNAFRTAAAMQQYLEKDARGGTRYNEFVYTHFGVRTQDSRLNRPEVIGGGYAPITTTAIPQTSATGLTGGTTPAGSLAASGHVQGTGGFTYSATEHGYVYVMVSARADITYQQGLRRMWTVSTRYDFPVPLLANLGEQSLLSREVYCDGTAGDTSVFGYVPRFDEYRYIPSQVVGIYRSTAAGTLDYWHSSQRFASRPTLNDTFITDDSKTVVQRNFAAGAATLGQQILADFFFTIKCARALPLYGIPGLTRL